MKRWIGISLNIALAAAGILLVPQLPPKAQEMVSIGLVSAVTAVTNKVSKSNPDGTPAQTAWEPKK